MRTSLPEIRETAYLVTPKAMDRPPTRHLVAPEAIKPPDRRSQKR
jgi:hypothetical protein